MPPNCETATVTSKWQITLPKSIRQALGVDVCGKVSLQLRGDTVIVTRAAEVAHEDPAIAGFLNLLEQDIQAGRNIRDLPEPLLRKMLTTLEQPVDLEVEIEGDIEL